MMYKSTPLFTHKHKWWLLGCDESHLWLDDGMVAIKGWLAVFVPAVTAAAFAPLELLSQFCDLKEVKTEMMNSIVHKKKVKDEEHWISSRCLTSFSWSVLPQEADRLWEPLLRSSTQALGVWQGEKWEDKGKQRLDQTIKALTDSFINWLKEGEDFFLSFFPTESYCMVSRTFGSWAFCSFFLQHNHSNYKLSL